MVGLIVLLLLLLFGFIVWIVVSKRLKKTTIDSFEEIGPFFDGFFKYVFNDLSKCPSKECSIKSPDICPSSGCCTKPGTLFAKSYGSILCGDDSSKADCNTINTNLPFAKIGYVLRYFEHFGLIQYKIGTYALSGSKEGNYYMLGGYKRLSWKNINDINMYDVLEFQSKYPDVYNHIVSLFEDTNVYLGDGNEEFDNAATYIRYIFWYFRKYVVDTMVSSSLLKHTVTGLSVGSTNITSDYDVTIYGDSYVNISAAIIEFNETFLKTFHERSSDVFDTNLYGVSPINMVTSETKPSSSKLNHNTYKFNTLFSPEVKTCSNKQFKYTKHDTNSKISQHIWALVTVLTHLKDVEEFDNKIYTYLMNKLVSSCKEPNKELGNNNFCNLLSVAENFINMYPVNLRRYTEVVKSLENTKVDINDFNNFISFVNYNGMETYVCRGTFLDVVVNQQMCQKKPTVVLGNEEYFDSLIENTACLLSHFRKDKYLNRVKYAFNNIQYLSEETKANVNEYLKTITDAQAVCNQEGTLIKCEPFIIMKNCIDIIIAISKEILNSSSEPIENIYFIS